MFANCATCLTVSPLKSWSKTWRNERGSSIQIGTSEKEKKEEKKKKSVRKVVKNVTERRKRISFCWRTALLTSKKRVVISPLALIRNSQRVLQTMSDMDKEPLHLEARARLLYVEQG